MTERQKVLMVDDDAALVDLMRHWLEAKGYLPVIARDGEEGLQKALEEKPDLIILDVLMPRMDGLNLFWKFKSADSLKHIPILVLTVRAFFEDLFREEGAEEFLLKPVFQKELFEKIEQLLKKQTLRSEEGEGSK